MEYFRLFNRQLVVVFSDGQNSTTCLCRALLNQLGRSDDIRYKTLTCYNSVIDNK